MQTTLARRHEAVVVTDAAGTVTFMNAAAQALTGWEPTAAQGRAVAEVVQVVASGATLLPPSGAVGMAWPTDRSVELAGHYLWRDTDSTVLPLAGGTTPLRDGAGHLLGVVWVFHDATADQQLVAHLQAVRRAQELRLREIHHRINNHFQTLASLLDLQADALEDPRALAAEEGRS